MLAEIKQYMTQHGTVSLRDLALHLESEPEAVRGMLSHWIERGRVQPLPTPDRCAHCTGACDDACLELYKWVGD
jgi:hypothetical protein